MHITQILKKRKAVAPIIATLLLVAIAVVGGIIVFTWASGMFGSTGGTTTPTVESLQLVGYDTRDTSDLSGLTTPAIDNTSDGELTKGSEFMVLKVRNSGITEVSISKVILMGVEHVVDSTPNDAPDAGEFLVYSGTSGDQSSAKSLPNLAAGEDARIVIKLSSSLPDDISLGRNLQLKIKTGSGNSFNVGVMTGQLE